MNLKNIFLVFFLTVQIPGFSSTFVPYQWEADRKPFTLNAADKEKPEFILKQHIQYDYELEDGNFVMFSTTHRIIRVNSNEAIQKHNRIVIPMAGAIELVDMKARSINKEGKAIFFDETNLKELKEEESGSAFRIFAIEGIELGSEVEYYFTRKMSGRIYESVFLQFDAPVKKETFRLTTPKHLQFDFKTYHNCPEVKASETEDKNVYVLELENVSSSKEEPYSYLSSTMKRLEFKLAINTARSKARLYTWEEAAKTFYKILTELEKDEVKALDKFVKSLKDNPSDKAAVRIKAIEGKIKTTIQVNQERRDPELSSLTYIVKNKVASREGITKLFVSVFSSLGISCHPLITCSRERYKFDGDFDSWAFLDDYFLYFPETRGFLAPYFMENSYPLVPSEYTAQKGLFIEPIEVGGIKSALGTIQEIPAPGFEISMDDLEINVNFNDQLDENEIHQVRKFGGYNAGFFTRYYDLMPEDKRALLVENITKQTAADAVLGTWKANIVPGIQTDDFILDVHFKSTHFLERAGPRILFKAGELIGPQVEMYRDDHRVHDVENDYNRAYNRVIRINLPNGYVLRNANDLKFEVSFKDQNKVPFLFKSDYTLKGNVLEIVITEFYKEIFVPVARYEDFRKVINAAADYNKVVLVLEKK